MSDVVDVVPPSRVANRQLWLDRLHRFSSSGLSVLAFCKAEGVSPNTFYYWKNLLAPASGPTTDSTPRLLPVTVQPTVPVELVLPGGAVLRLSPGCDLAFVRSLLDALGGVSC